VGGALVYGIL